MSFTAANDDLFETFFDLSLTGAMLLAAVPDAAGQVADFRYVRLNPAAQRMLGLPEQPAESFLTRYPHALPTGIFAFYRAALLAGETQRAEFNYQYDGLDNYYHLAARRVGDKLLVSFTDTSDQPRTAVELALRESQTREQAARAEVEAERWRLHQVLLRIPANIALLRGPEHTYTFVNPEYSRLFPERSPLGCTIREFIPEIAGQGFYELFDRVYETGEPFYDAETKALANFASAGKLQRRYYRTAFEPIRNAQGEVTEVLNFAVDVTAQVEARQRIEQLNQELDARVQERTRQLEAAHAATERERRRWEKLFWHAPAAICIFDGPEWVYEYVNPGYQAMFPGRDLLGRRLIDALPEMRDQPLMDILHRVYDTGEPFEASEVLVPLARTAGGPIEDIYFDLTYQARRNEAGQIDGFITHAYDVTEQVSARRQADAMQVALLAAAQHQARQREELFQVFEQAPAAIVLLREPHHRIEYVNPAYQQFFPGVALRDRLLAEAHPGSRTDGTLVRLDRVYETGEPYVGEEQPVQLVLAPGQPPQTRYFNFTYQPYREQGRIVGVSIFAYDVTAAALVRQQAARQARQVAQLNQELEARVQERTRQLEAAQAATERERLLLQALFAQAPVAIALYQGLDMTVASANEHMTALWDRSPAQVLGRPLLAVVPELQGQGFDDLLRQVLATQVPYVGSEAPATMLRKGELATTYYNYVYQPLYNAAGEVLGVINVAVEVTEQVLARRRIEQLNQELDARVQERTRQLEAAQAATERERMLLQQVLSQAPAYVATFAGPNHIFSFINQGYEQVLTQGRARVGYSVAELFPELVEQGFLAVLDQVYVSGQAVFQPEAKLVQRDPATGLERITYVDATYQPLRDEQGRVFGLLAFANDVTEQVLARRQVEEVRVEVQTLNEELATTNEELRATNEELQEINAQLTHTNADLDTFVYTASHDLKAPITNIEGLVLALRQELPATTTADPIIKHLLELMEKSVARFLQTIGQLTDVSRIQQTAQEPAEAVDLVHLLEDIRLDLAPLFDSTRAQLLYDLAACSTVLFPLKNLRSIFYNLISNALKYRDPARPPVVRVRAVRAGQYVVLEVQDNGLGLSEAQQGNLFVLFKRLHTHVEGSGVGLYMLKRIVENARGTITVHSEPGKGSTFTVALPRL